MNDTAERIPLIAGNWKMHKTIAEAEAFVGGLLPRVADADGVEVALCVPFTALQAVVDSTRGSRVEVYAQNMHDAPQGAFTGEVSAAMLTELDVHGVLLGHSERRELFGETDRALQQKVPAAFAAGLAPMLCVGETEEEREAGDTERKLRHQVQEGLEKVPAERLPEVVIAYEPIWAIGTGQVATPAQAQEAIAFVRALVAGFDKEAAERVRVLYGGSVKPENAAELMALPDVDGALVGGASLEPDTFAAIVAAARRLIARMAHDASVCLVVLDGWGLAPDGPGNAIAQAHTPVMDELRASFPHARLRTCGPDVGLPPGQMGNSEVGHLNLGAGAVVKQDLTRIDEALDPARAPIDNAVLRGALGAAERVHLMGLVSDGGVHASLEHLAALVALGRELGVPDLVVHAFTDGRDTSPTGGAGYLERVESLPGARVGTVIGRYYAMDRDRRAERTERARALLVDGVAEHHVEHAADAAREAYARGETDEFITATTVGAEARIRPGDAVIAFNFRPDRMREITVALDHDPARYVTMTEYEEGWPYPVAFPPHRPAATLPAVVAAAGLRQLHVAETEKYPHVTYFFGGGEETPQEGERRELVDSPRDVPTYDHKPAMSAPAATRAFAEAWRDGGFGFGIINFANADMVGHTGVIPAAVEAVETVDRCLGEVVETVRSTGGTCVITADHGNADHMLDDDGAVNTAHSLNPVPFLVTRDGVELRDEGILADVAPTVLDLLGIAQPAEMTGRTMIR